MLGLGGLHKKLNHIQDLEEKEEKKSNFNYGYLDLFKSKRNVNNRDSFTAKEIIKLRNDPSSLSEKNRDYLKIIDEGLDNQELWSVIPDEKEIVFLNAVRKNKNFTLEEMEKTASTFDIDQIQLKKIIEKKWVNPISKKQADILNLFKRGMVDNLNDEIKNKDLNTLKDMGIVAELKPNEKKLLIYLNNKPILKESVEFETARKFYHLEKSDVFKLEKFGWLNINKSDEKSSDSPKKIKCSFDLHKVNLNVVNWHEDRNFRDIRNENITKDGIDLKLATIKNNEFFFLNSIKPNDNKIHERADSYGVNLDELKRKGLLDYLSSSEEKKLKSYREGNLKLSDFEIENFENRFFIKSLKSSEKEIIESLKKLEPKNENEISDFYNAQGVSEKTQKTLENWGFVDYIDSNEIEIVEEAKSQSLQKHAFYDFLKDKGIDNVFRVLNRTTFDNDGKIEFDKDIKLTTDPKFSLGFKNLYSEDIAILEEREKFKPKYSLESNQNDRSLLIDNFLEKELSDKKRIRLSELNTFGVKFENLSIPSNIEKEFLHKINNTTLKDEEVLKDRLNKIASEDFNLNSESVSKLMDISYISVDNKFKIKNNWYDPKSISKARIYANNPIKEFNSDSDKLSKHFKNTFVPAPIKLKSQDYFVYFKDKRSESLTPSESFRIQHLKENGINIRSTGFRKMIFQEQKSWRLNSARKKAFLDHYEKTYGVDRDVLKFVNNFKQVTEKQLFKLGLNKEKFERYANGIDQKGTFALLQKNTLPHYSGKIDYYSITHEGPISGRAFLEQDLTKNEISKKPQNRKDLLYHDLKVVDCVLEVKDEYLKKGYKLKNIVSENKQFSDHKKNKQNDERQDNLTYLDASLVFEYADEQETPSVGGGNGTVNVGVEYGNYPNERMENKLRNSEFDQAYVYASPGYIKNYKQNIFIGNVTYRNNI